MNIIQKFLKTLRQAKEQEKREIAQLIGDFYFGKYKHLTIKERYEKTREDITTLGITEIHLKGVIITITLQRIGLLIGRRGENIENLQKYLGLNSKYKKLDVKEDKIISWLMPYHYVDEYEADWIEEEIF